MERVKKNFGFGCMRLPMNGTEVDTKEFSEMIDTFMEAGFNYFDTAHGYLDGKSELALRECLTSRYPRESYILTNKLSAPFFKKQEEIRPFFEKQLEACGVDYFDFYLMHAQSAERFETYKKCRAYETAFELKAEGKVRYVGLSFHDKAAVLEQILKEYPEIEVVQIQFNYVDYEDPVVEARKCYEVCRKYDKPVIVMEPVRGGSLVNLRQEALDVLAEDGSGSPASYAIRYAAGFEGMFMVLSGMSNMEQMKDNISFMKDFHPLNEKEMGAVQKVQEMFKALNLIPCTGCEYCLAGCPKQIQIPSIFKCMNNQKIYQNWSIERYHEVTKESKASDCIRCGKCEEACPQHLKIRELLSAAANEFENV